MKNLISFYIRQFDVRRARRRTRRAFGKSIPKHLLPRVGGFA